MVGRRTLLWLFTALLALALSGCSPCSMRQKNCGDGCCMQSKENCRLQTSAAPAAEVAARKDVLYTCNCGSDCQCNTVRTQPGNCACGKPLVWGHLLRVSGDEALLCTCKEGCQCQLDPKDPSLCGCGSPVKRVSMKGTGLYFCNCGGSCACNTVGTEPATCRCGMPLKTVK